MDISAEVESDSTQSDKILVQGYAKYQIRPESNDEHPKYKYQIYRQLIDLHEKVDKESLQIVFMSDWLEINLLISKKNK